MLNRRFSLTRKPHAKALYLFFIAILLIVALGIAPAKPVQAYPVPLAGAVSPNTAWSALPNQGFDDWVLALTLSDDDLYVGGNFTQTNDETLTNLGYIARYNITTSTLHALPNQGLNDGVRALAVSRDDLYVGGLFTETGDGTLTDLNGIARYDITEDKWYALPNQGLKGLFTWYSYSCIFSLLAVGDDLYVGGLFTETGDEKLTDLNGIARYDITEDKWYAMPNQGFDDGVWEIIATSGDDLFIGGHFDQTGDGALTSLGGIVRYDIMEKKWVSLPNHGLYDWGVRALAISKDDLYVGGTFLRTGDGTLEDLGNIARYDITENKWYALPNQGLVDRLGVMTLAVLRDDLYAGGYFSQTGDGTLEDLGNIARFNTTEDRWYTMPNQGFNAWVLALMLSGDDLYVGGKFIGTVDGSLADLGNIARYAPAVNTYLPMVIRQ